MKVLISLSLIAGFSSLSAAQFASLTWQVSNDGGATWLSAIHLSTGGSVDVRAVASWSGINGALGFSNSQFDAIVQNAQTGDSVSNISRRSPFDLAPQSLFASTYAGGIKIDDQTDGAAPGVGTGWINVGQGSASEIGTRFNSSNPVVVLSYSLFVTDQGPNRTLTNIFNPSSGSAFSVYTSSAGAQTRLDASSVAINTASISVGFFPTPGTSAGLLMCSALTFCRRR